MSDQTDIPQLTPNDGAPGPANAAGDDTHVAENPSDTDGLLLRLQHDFYDARRHRAEWRKEAMRCFDFVAGHQWSEEDLNVLRTQERPAITFNRIGPYIDSVCGLEINNRQEQRIIPRQIGSAGVSDLLTGAVKWVRDETDAEDEESAAFRDALVCGEGWTETRLSYDDDPDGMISIVHTDPLEMYPDPASRRANYADARYVFRVRDVPVDYARTLAPDVADSDLDATWAYDQAENADQPHNRREAPFYRNDQSGKYERGQYYVRLVHVEWWEYATAYRTLDPTSGRLIKLTPQLMALWRRIAPTQGMEVKQIQDRTRVYRSAIIGNKILKLTDGNEKGGFSFKAITGKRDHKKKCYYGLVRAMQDPQQWANKWLSQVLNIINKNAKGGLIAETDAFENPTEAEDSWANPEAITWVEPGALTQGKLKDKPAITFPNGIQQLMQYAVSSISDVIGSNPEMMGQADRAQAGVVEEKRKQSAMTIFADLFNGLRRYRKEQGRLLLWLIQEFIADGRLIRIGGPDQMRYVPLIHDPQMIEYDVVVDDTPWSPNMKERTWGALQLIMPIMAKLGVPPQIWMEALKYSPLPQTFIEKATEIMQQQQASGPGQMSPTEQALVSTEQAKAGLHAAQAEKVKTETALMPLKQRMEAMLAQLEMKAKEANIENTRATAVGTLAKVGLDQQSQALDEAQAAVDALLAGHSAAMDAQQAAHGRQMDQIGAAQQGQQMADQRAQFDQQQQAAQAQPPS